MQGTESAIWDAGQRSQMLVVKGAGYAVSGGIIWGVAGGRGVCCLFGLMNELEQ